MQALRIGFLGYDGVTALDFVGPMEAFAEIPQSPGAARNRVPRYELTLIGVHPKPFVAASGITFKPQETIHSVMNLDTLIIPGGPGSRRPEIVAPISDWLLHTAPKVRRVVTVCTGLYLLAPTGLLDGLRVTTHWHHASDIARRFPRLQMDDDAIFVKSGRFYTSAGITAGIDLALYLIEEDLGRDVALSTARNLVVYLKRNGGQRQFSEPLRLQSKSSEGLQGLSTWMTENLARDLSVDVLANKCNLSRRHFCRVFKNMYGGSPSEVVESLRLDEARNLLAEPNASIERVATCIGFSCADTFRRAFSRRFGISPSGYRATFES